MHLALWLIMSTVLLAPLPQANTSKSSLDTLHWLAGSWRMDRGAKVIEEQWTKPAGGLMLGMSRTVANGKTVSFEFVRIEERGDSLVYVAQPGGQPPTEFKLDSAADNEIVFANPQHDFPQKIRYRRNADGSVTARIEDASGKKFVEFPYTAAK